MRRRAPRLCNKLAWRMPCTVVAACCCAPAGHHATDAQGTAQPPQPATAGTLALPGWSCWRGRGTLAGPPLGNLSPPQPGCTPAPASRRGRRLHGGAAGGWVQGRLAQGRAAWRTNWGSSCRKRAQGGRGAHPWRLAHSCQRRASGRGGRDSQGTQTMVLLFSTRETSMAE